MSGKTGPRVQAEPLKDFCVRVFQKMGVPEADARITADVLVTANLRGVDSHGVARLRRYVDGLQSGMMVAQPEVQVVTETPATALIDAGAGLGQPVSYRAMEKAIEKALDVGAGFVTVRNSNHYGIAGYYAMMALDHNCIGISMTNAAVLVVPTFGRDAMLGTNPIAVAAPADRERPFVLDMATSTVPRGKLEVYHRLEKPLPSKIGHFFGAWRVDGFRPADEFKAAMDDLQQRLKNAPKAEDQDRIYVHGEKEYEEAERRSREGIPLNPKVAVDLEAIAGELGIAYDL